MPRLTQRDTRKGFLSLYRFIETDLTEENWRDLTWQAARLFLPYKPPERPPAKRARILRKHGAARYRAVDPDVSDLEGARALQERYGRELAALRRGETWPAHTSISRLMETRFDRLKRLLTVPPLYVKEHVHAGGVRSLEMRGHVYGEGGKTIERVCPSCGETYTAPPGRKRTSCGDRACRIDVENMRRKPAGKTRRPSR